jgi:hypothetical protein
VFAGILYPPILIIGIPPDLDVLVVVLILVIPPAGAAAVKASNPEILK